MKKFLALSALVLGMVSCQTEPEGFDVNVGGEQDVNITVSLPEGTRADSALGAFENVDFTKYDVRFQCEVHYGDQVKVLPVQYGRGNDAVATATFPVRLIANREYTFVVWADLVAEGSESDLHYDTTNGLSAIEIIDWKAMDETRDAYTCSEKRMFTRANGIGETLTLTRPFAKLRVITTDMEELMGVKPTWAKVEYTTPYYENFNALKQMPYEQSSTGKAHSDLFDIVSYDENGASKTLFADYFFAKNAENGQAPETVAFTMEVFDENGATIDEPKTFNTSIPVKRNYLTTIKGNILTYADDFTVTIEDAFENADKIEDQPYYQVPVTNGADLLKAISEGREIIALNNIVVTEADKNFKEAVARRSNTSAKNPVLNLNGKTITFVNNGTDALITIPAGSSLTINDGDDEENKGTIVVDGAGAAIKNNGTINIDGVAIELGENAPEGTKAIENNGTAIIYNTEIEEGVIENSKDAIIGNYVYTAEELVAALKANENVFFANDITVAATSGGYNKAGILQNKCQTIDGNGYTLTVTGAGATWDCAIYTNGGVIKNLTVAGAMRGIFTAGLNSDLYIDNVTFKNVIYTFNSDDGNKQYGVYVSNSTVNGWTSFSNVHKEVVFTNCSFGKGSGYAFCRPYNVCSFVNCEFSEGYEIDARGVSTFDNCTLNGVAVTAENIATLVTGNITNAKLAGVDGTFVSNGDQLVAALENNATVILANDIEMEAKQSSGYGKAGVVVVPGKTINGNGKTLKVTNAGGTWDCAICAKGGTIKNLTIAQGFRGIFMPGATGDVFIENVTFNGPVYTFNSDAGNKNYGVYLSNCTINGWTSHSDVHKEVVYTNCTFGKANGYAFCRPYGPTTFVGCNFCEGYSVDAIGVSTFVECKLNGVAVTADNLATLASGKAVLPGVVTTNDEFVAALANNSYVTVAAGEYKFPASSVKAGQTIDCKEGVVFTGTSSLNINGATVIGATFKNEGGQAVSGTVYGTFKNCTFIGAETLRWCYTSEGKDVVFENCVIKTTLRGFHFDEMNSNVTFKNCEINGFNAYSGAGTITFEGCTFGHDASKYNGLNIYTNTNVVNSTFNFVSGKTNFIDMEGTGKTLTITNCTATLDGAAANVVEFVGGSKLADNTVVIK